MIYIVIPVHNRRTLTRNCLKSLIEQEMKDFTVIVVDDGSSDGTSDMIREEFPDTVLLEGDGNLWWAGSINNGIRYVLNVCEPSDFILTLNDDLIVPPDYLSSLIKAAKKHPGAIIGSVETTLDESSKLKGGGILVNWKTAKVMVMNVGRYLEEFPSGYSIKVSRVTGRGTLYPIKVFREVGLFDDKYIKHCADTELPVRANFNYGYPLFISYDSIVISDISDNQSINSKKRYSINDAAEYFFGIRSHFNLKNRYWITRSIAPNVVWFVRFLFLDIARTVGHFVVRFRIKG